MDTSLVKKCIEECTKKLTIDIESIEEVQNELHPIFHIHTKDSMLLIGNNGETLYSLNHIIKKIIEKEGHESKFLIDVNKYYEKKIEELKSQARLSAERVKAFSHEVELPAMNAYERMVIHSLFADDPCIETLSDGQGKFRHIVLFPKDENKKEEEVT